MRKRMIVFRMIFGRYNLKIPKLDTPCLTTFFEGTTRPTMATRLPDPPGQGRAGIPGNTSLNSHSLDGMGMQFFIAVPNCGMSNGMECFKISFRYWSCDVSKKRRGGWSGIEIPLILGSKEASHSNPTDSNLRTCCCKTKVCDFEFSFPFPLTPAPAPAPLGTTWPSQVPQPTHQVSWRIWLDLTMLKSQQ